MLCSRHCECIARRTLVTRVVNGGDKWLRCFVKNALAPNLHLPLKVRCETLKQSAWHPDSGRAAAFYPRVTPHLPEAAAGACKGRPSGREVLPAPSLAQTRHGGCSRRLVTGG